MKYRREHQNLRIPGPVPCPTEVIDAQTLPLIDHRGQDFGHMLKNLVERLKRIFLTENDVFILTSSGTGALEASLVNTLSPGDKILDFEPTFGMYSFCAEVSGAEVQYIQRDDLFEIDVLRAKSQVLTGTKLIFVTSPNNPTRILAV